VSGQKNRQLSITIIDISIIAFIISYY
jgi:hypothetical protein